MAVGTYSNFCAQVRRVLLFTMKPPKARIEKKVPLFNEKYNLCVKINIHTLQTMSQERLRLAVQYQVLASAHCLLESNENIVRAMEKKKSHTLFFLLGLSIWSLFRPLT